MEMEVGAATGAAYGEKGPLRTPSATAIATATGRRGPGPSNSAPAEAREGSFFPGFLEPRGMAAKALTACGWGGLRPGCLDPLVDDLVKAMGMGGISKSQFSRLCEEIDGKVKAFLEGR